MSRSRVYRGKKPETIGLVTPTLLSGRQVVWDLADFDTDELKSTSRQKEEWAQAAGAFAAEPRGYSRKFSNTIIRKQALATHIFDHGYISFAQ